MNKLGRLFGNNDNNDDGNGSGGLFLIAAVGLAIWAFTGFYTVDERERGVVLQFGAYNETTTAGLHWKFPAPIETVELVDVDNNRIANEQSTMLTLDENIVDLSVSVQYKIKSAEDYLFNVANLDNTDSQKGTTIHQVMRSAIREVVGRSTMDSILKEGREMVAQDTEKLMQQTLDNYKSGILVTKVNLTYAEAPKQVKDAFDDANRARENMNQYKNEALAHKMKVIPEARGQAARMVENAKAYRDQVIAQAEGDADRFSKLVVEYQQAPDVTRERLYLETMENVLGNTRKVMVDSQSGNNLIYLPLDQLNASQSSNMSRAPAIDPAAAAAIAAQQQTPTTPTQSSVRQPRDLSGQR
ncbi:MAG: FtsH protease activity modulator HflK [bacterium]